MPGTPPLARIFDEIRINPMSSGRDTNSTTGSLLSRRWNTLKYRAEVRHIHHVSRLGRPDVSQHRVEASVDDYLMTSQYFMELGKGAKAFSALVL